MATEQNQSTKIHLCYVCGNAIRFGPKNSLGKSVRLDLNGEFHVCPVKNTTTTPNQDKSAANGGVKEQAQKPLEKLQLQSQPQSDSKQPDPKTIFGLKPSRDSPPTSLTRPEEFDQKTVEARKFDQTRIDAYLAIASAIKDVANAIVDL